MNPSYLKEYGPGLISNGYKIIPIKKGSKIPAVKGWTKIDADHDQLEQWVSDGLEGIGISCKNSPAVDIDVLDEEVSSQMVDAVLQQFPGGLVRVGKAPKTLLAYRTDKPFKKVRSCTYKDIFDDHHAVEVLGDGQQYVAYGDHPDTLKPYEWIANGSGSPPGINEIERDSLPLLNLEDARAVIAEFEKIATEKVATDEWEKVKDGTNGSQMENEDAEGQGDFQNLRPRLGLSDKDIQRALDSVAKPDYWEYDNWIKVGMALWHETNGSAEGLEYWVQWSEKDPEFVIERDCRSRWPGFRPGRGSRVTTMATVLKWARDERLDENPLQAFKERFVYIMDGDSVHDLEGFGHDKPALLKEFKNMFANVRMEIQEPRPRDGIPDRTVLKVVPVHKQWMIDPERQSAHGSIYVPGGPEMLTDAEGRQWINNFHLPVFANPCETVAKNGATKMAAENVESLLRVFFRHMEFIIPIEEEREWFYSWMAFNIQRPEKRCKVTPLLIATDHGTGRGWIVQLMNHLLGSWNCTKTKMSTLSGESTSGQFQEFMNDSLLCCVEEVREGEKRYGVAESIRDYLTENTLEINIKYGAKQTKPVYTNFIFNSNQADALKLTEDDRRINVFRTVDGPKPNDYYDRLYRWLEPEGKATGEVVGTIDENGNGDAVYDRAGVKVSSGVACLFHWLKNRDLSGFNWQRSMHNKARQEMIENNQTDIEYRFLEMAKNPPSPVMTLMEIVDFLGDQSETLEERARCQSAKGESQIKVLMKQHLKRLNKIKLSRGRDLDGEIVTLDKPRSIRGWSLVKNRNFSTDEIRKMYENR
jgi:hypothetical protein